MDVLLIYAVWAVLIISGLGLLAMVLFGIRSLWYGKIEATSAAIVIVPGIVLLIMGIIVESWAEAAIWTLAIMFAFGVIGVLLSGIRGLFT